MNFKTIFDWSEAWAPLIPLLVLLWQREQPKYINPVIFYLILSFIFNTFSDLVWQQGTLGITMFTKNNNPIYNLHSISRFFLFAIFFNLLEQPFATTLKQLLPVIFFVFVIIDLIFLEDFFAPRIANIIHSVEAGLLLLYSLFFYYFLLRSEITSITSLPSFWIVTGLLVFVGVSFPVYLYYGYILEHYKGFTVDIWSVQKTAFLFFCLAVSIGFSVSKNAKTLQYE